MGKAKKLQAPVEDKSSGVKVKTLIVTDYMGTLGTEPEEEAEEIARHFWNLYRIELEYTHFTAIPEDLEPYKLIIIDYGGLLPGADNMRNYQVRAVCKWAEDHPSRLLLFWTSFTSRVWKFDLAGEGFEELGNVLHWEPINEHGIESLKTTEDIFKHWDKTALTIKTILGG